MYYRNTFRKPSRNHLTLSDGFVKINTDVYSKTLFIWHPTVRPGEENVICNENEKEKAIYNLCLYRQTPFKIGLWLMPWYYKIITWYYLK